jgi:hypothetical protein
LYEKVFDGEDGGMDERAGGGIETVEVLAERVYTVVAHLDSIWVDHWDYHYYCVFLFGYIYWRGVYQ